MQYYAQYNDDNALIAIGTGIGGIEITEDEYNSLLAEIRDKAALVDQLYSGEITIDNIPEEWRDEIQSRVDERTVYELEYANEIEATDEDYIAALAELGVSVNEES